MTHSSRRSLFSCFLLAAAVTFGTIGPEPALGGEPLILRQVVEISPSDVSIVRRGGTDVIHLRGGTISGVEGAPDLPVLPITFRLPEGMKVDGATARVLESRTLKGLFSPAVYRTVNSDGRMLDIPAAPMALDGEGAYPAELVRPGTTGRMRGRTLGGVIVTPFRFIERESRLDLVTRIEIEVRLAEDDRDRSQDFVPLRREPWADATFGQLAENLAINGTPASAARKSEGELRPLTNSGAPFAPTFRPSVNGSPVEMVIITNSVMEPEYQRLADWKTRSGIPTVVRTVAWIQQNYPNGSDTQETIRNFIRDAAQKWGTVWVLLGADTDVIPTRYGRTLFFGGEEIPTDLYYQCVDGTWNADGDAKYGEGFGSTLIPGDAADLYPEVWIGRLSTITQTEAMHVVNKILAYEMAPKANGYQDDFLALGEVLFPQNYSPGDSVLFDGADVCQSAISYLPGNWTVTKLYERCPHAAWPTCILEDKPTVVDSINAGYGIVHHVGHGYINTMAVGKDDKALTNADADAASNGDETFFLYAINCTSSAIDFNCIAERYLLNPNGGSVASVGSTRFDFPSTGWSYQNEFYRLVFQAGIHELGRAESDSKLPFIPLSSQDNTHRWTQFTQIYFGDPSMPIYTVSPAPLAVSHSATHPLGTANYSVSVLSGGNPVDSARVCINKANDEYVVGYTNASGNAVLSFVPDSTGTFQVTVVADNKIPYLGSGTVTTPVTPYLHATSQVIDDNATGASFGNSDGKIDSGETIELSLPLRNRGGATGAAITATMTSLSPFITVSDSTSTYAALGSGAAGNPADPIVFTVGRTAPDRTEAKVRMTYVSGAATIVEDIVLYVHAPVFEWHRMFVRDTTGTGNSNNIVEPNEDIRLRVELRNGGLGQARSIIAKLRSTDPVFVLTDSVVDFGTIAGGTRAVSRPPTDTFGFRMVDTTGAATSAHRMFVDFHDTYSPSTPLATILIDPVGPLFAPSGMKAIGSTGSIALTFDPVSTADLAGYNIYRSATMGGPYTRVNQYTTKRTAYYNDEGLPPLSVFYYKVAPQDSAGIEGPLSVEASASTTLPIHPGFPVELTAATNASVTLADLDYNGDIEILAGAEEVYALQPNGEEFFDGDGDIRTLGPLTNTGGFGFWNAPAVGDVEPDGIPDVAAVSWPTNLYLWNNKGQIKPGWPKNLNVQSLIDPNPLGSVTMGDVDGDGDLELFVQCARAIFGFHHDGTEIVDGDSNPATIGVLRLTPTAYSYATPALADLNGDGMPELICGMRDGKVYVMNPITGANMPGFPYSAGGNITASPAVADIDNDGQPDIVVAASTSTSIQMQVLKANGTMVTGWPQGISMNEDFDSSPAVGDLTGDGIPDIVCGASNGRVFAWRNTGAILAGWPVIITNNLGQNVPVRSSPILVDVDNNGVPEVIVGDQEGRLHAFYANGTKLPGFPIQTGNLIEGGPAAWDLDGDGLTEIVAESFDQKVYIWDTPWTFNKMASPWPMFHHDARHTGNLAEPLFLQTAVPETPAAGIKPYVLKQNYPNPFNPVTRIPYRIETSDRTGTTVPVRLSIYSATGRLVRVLVDSPMPGGEYEVGWDGMDASGQPVSSGVYFYSITTPHGRESRSMTMIR